MAYSGKYKIKNYKKYKGDPTKVIYRSLWELKFMKYCDHKKNIIEWSSEEIIIPYRCLTDNKYHRYFTDFWIKYKKPDGKIYQSVIEIKPLQQTIRPKECKTKRGRKRYLQEIYTWGKNVSKWAAAEEYCKKRNMEFKILTERDLF